MEKIMEIMEILTEARIALIISAFSLLVAVLTAFDIREIKHTVTKMWGEKIGRKIPEESEAKDDEYPGWLWLVVTPIMLPGLILGILFGCGTKDSDKWPLWMLFLMLPSVLILMAYDKIRSIWR